MKLTNAELIAEAIAIHHREVAPRTLAKYRKHLDHLDEYLSSAHGVTLLELPDLDLATRMKPAKVETTIGYTPTVEEVKLLLESPGTPSRHPARVPALLRAVPQGDVRAGLDSPSLRGRRDCR